MNLPDYPHIDTEILRDIARSHDLGDREFRRLPEIGIFNAIFSIGDDLILRVPRDHPISTSDARKEAVAVPAAREAGVRTPRILAFDETLDLLPVPYSIYERVPGKTLGLLARDPASLPEVWRELGYDLALLHENVPEDSPVAGLECGEIPDPRPWPVEMATEGYFTTVESDWLTGWLELLAPVALAPVRRRFLHGDTQATNVMVGAESLEYAAVLDWGNAGWGDPAWDFAGVPLRIVPFMLEGYRAVGSPEDNETIEARILWRHLQLSLFLLRREPQPGRSWAERPLAMLLDVMRFLLESPEERWSRWIP